MNLKTTKKLLKYIKIPLIIMMASVVALTAAVYFEVGQYIYRIFPCENGIVADYLCYFTYDSYVEYTLMAIFYCAFATAIIQTMSFLVKKR